MDATSQDWLLTLSNHWQFAAGLRQCATLADIETALEMVVELPVHADRGLERMLVRGFLLEVAEGVRAVSRIAPAGSRSQLLELCDRLSRAGHLDADLRNRVGTLLARLRHRPSLRGPRLAYPPPADSRGDGTDTASVEGTGT